MVVQIFSSQALIIHAVKILCALVWLASCASTNRNLELEYKNFISENRHREALQLIKGKQATLYTREEDDLLRALEIGSIHFKLGEYFQALQSFDKAYEIHKKLFTVRLAQKLEAAVTNDQNDHYYGSAFEGSTIRFQQSLLHYLLWQEGKYEAHQLDLYQDKNWTTQNIPEKILSDSERRSHLQSSRSILIEWDSYLTELKNKNPGKVEFKEDLMHKFWGAMVHQTIGLSQDLQTAKSLYVSTENVMLKYYNAYVQFNEKFQQYKNEYEKLHLKSPKDVLSFVESTRSANLIKKFAEDNLAILKDKKISNVSFLIEDGMISPVKVEKIDIPIPITVAPAGAYISNGEFQNFSVRLYGIGVTPKIYFEMPSIPLIPPTRNLQYEIFQVPQASNPDQMTALPIQKGDLPLINPMSEFQKQKMLDDRDALKTRIGARLIAKHLAAIASSYALYKLQEKSLGPSMAMLLAMSAYQVATLGIAESEKADVRMWTSLPNAYYFMNGYVPPGNYRFHILEDGKILQKKDFIINKDHQFELIRVP